MGFLRFFARSVEGLTGVEKKSWILWVNLLLIMTNGSE